MNLLPKRIQDKIEVQENECWYWIAYTDPDGYGRVRWNNKAGYFAHRAVYEILVGHISEGLQVDHLCRVRHCVNPKHMEPVTNKENINRGSKNSTLKGQFQRNKTHCSRGHPYDVANTYVTPKGWRMCRACR